MHGAGNDYIYINALSSCPENLTELAKTLSDRHKGVGADGIVIILPSEIADFRMRMFNSDGSEGKMCGNASRCVAKYVFDKKLTSKRTITLETLSGIKQMKLFLGEDGEVSKVTVDMGEPIFTPREIPVNIDVDEVINYKLESLKLPYNINCISMGNPHCVLFGNKWTDDEVEVLGQKIETNELFPERVNVEFAKVENPTEITLRVWERGSGETMACGTGACATVVAAIKNGLCKNEVTVHLLGGDLDICWNLDNHIMMTGDAHLIFEGEYIWKN